MKKGKGIYHQLKDNKAKPYKKGDITKDKIEEVVNYIMNQSKTIKDRKASFIRGCKTYGLLEGVDHCGDKECDNCNNIMHIFKNVVENELKESMIDIDPDIKKIVDDNFNNLL